MQIIYLRKILPIRKNRLSFNMLTVTQIFYTLEMITVWNILTFNIVENFLAQIHLTLI